jgi:hypothetical protein
MIKIIALVPLAIFVLAILIAIMGALYSLWVERRAKRKELKGPKLKGPIDYHLSFCNRCYMRDNPASYAAWFASYDFYLVNQSRFEWEEP